MYAATKQSFQDIIKFYEEEYGLQCITLKLCDTYGEDDGRKKIINLLKQAYQKDEELDMTKGEQYLSLTYIDDVVKGIILASDYVLNSKYCGYTYFLANKDIIKLQNLVRSIEKIANKKLKINWGKIQYKKREIMRPYIGNILPGWEIKTAIDVGLRKVFKNI